MSFIDHIEELRWHIIRSIIALLVFATFAFANIEWIYTHILLGPTHGKFISYRALCWLSRHSHITSLCLGDIALRFQSTELSGQFMMGFSSSITVGFVLAFPYIFWEFWRFIKPALKEKERSYARGIVFWSSLLFFIGVLFAYYVVAPFTINFFAGYKLADSIENIITVNNYYDTLSSMVMGLGVVFELPILVYFLTRIGILTPTLLRKRRRLSIFIIIIVAQIVTPPDWFSWFLVAFPLYFLFELSIGISSRVVKRMARRALED